MDTKWRAALVASVLFTVSSCGRDQPDVQILLSAVRGGDTHAVKDLLKRRVDPNGKNPEGETPLVIAAMQGNVEIMKLLVEGGAHLELTAKRDITPLIAAIAAGKADAVKWLLDAGAKIDTSTDKGVTPLMFAVIQKQARIAGFLIDRGANVNAKNSSGTSVLILAITNGQEDTARKLIDKGADVNVQTDGNRTTALMMASHHDMRQTARLLLTKGARRDFKDSHGKSALDYAKSEEMKDLLTKGANDG